MAPRFEYSVLRMLLSKGKITKDLITLLRSWRPSGFLVYGGPRIQLGEDEAPEKLENIYRQTLGCWSEYGYKL